MDISQKEKQEYLFKEVIEKNHDPEEFQEYLLQAKAGGDDLDNWPLQELKEAVRAFQKKCNKDEKDNEEGNQELEKRKTKIDQYLETDESVLRSKYEESGQTYDQDCTSDSFNQIIRCTPIAPSPLLNTKNVSPAVIKFQKKEGGIFEKSYVSYFVQTTFLEKTVERRYSDFEWLKATLEWLHPGIPVPPIAKKGQFRRYDDKHLRKRMMILEMFLKKLLDIPELRAEPLVEQFLAYNDKASFEKLKANYKPTGKIVPLKTIQNIQGTLVTAADPKTGSFISGAQKHFEVVQPLVKTLYKDFKASATSLQACGAVLKGLGAQCETIDLLQRKFRKQNELSYCPNNFFTILSEAISRLGQQMLNQATIFRTEFYSLIKYDSLYMINLIDNFQVLEGIKEKFQSCRNSLLKKKEKLFSEGHVQKWQLQKNIDKSNRRQAMANMLPKENKKLAKIRDIYGLYNFEMFQQIQRYFSTKNVEQGLRLQQFCKNQTRLCTQMMMIWVDAETNIMGMKENKSIRKC